MVTVFVLFRVRMVVGVRRLGVELEEGVAMAGPFVV